MRIRTGVRIVASLLLLLGVHGRLHASGRRRVNAKPAASRNVAHSAERRMPARHPAAARAQGTSASPSPSTPGSAHAGTASAKSTHATSATTKDATAKTANAKPVAAKTPATGTATKTGAPARSAAARRRVTTRRQIARQRMPTAPSSDRITEIQSALANDGVYQGSPNGKWDQATTDAMQRFQTAHGLSPTGKIDAASLQKLGLGSEIAGKGAPLPEAAASTADPQTAINPQSPSNAPAQSNTATPANAQPAANAPAPTNATSPAKTAAP